MNYPTTQTLISLFIILIFAACTPQPEYCEGVDPTQANTVRDSLKEKLSWTDDLEFSYFVGPELTPSPACMAVAPTGEVFVGVDMIGSLGKEPGKGRIVKLIDCNHDGVADDHTIFAEVDNPRGILPIGDKVYVLYTTFFEDTAMASGMDLVVFEDKNQDGIADGPSQPLIQNISSPKFLQSRGTDHATNGIRMGIDGWIYIAVGDFGFHDAVDQSGKKFTQLGGGVLRIRPDGTETEVYTHGLRNIYDVAIDPYMNIFTRGNTNDGGGWNIRFIHQTQSGEYGYPVLFKHFTNEIIPALIDVGGGSGAGSFFMDEPGWPKKYNQVPMMADWGRNELYIHRVTEDGASFTQTEETFIQLPQITDLDVDGSGRLFMSAWDGAGYTGDSTKGFVVRAVPKDWKYKPFPNLKDASISKLGDLLNSNSAVARLHAQQELLNRNNEEATKTAWKIASGKGNSLEARIAGIFTYAQLAEENGIDNLVSLASDSKVKEFALRALADRKPWTDNVPLQPFIEAMSDPSVRVQVAASVGLGRLGKVEAAEYLLKVPVPKSWAAPVRGTEGLHATPNSAVIPAHIAVKALVNLHAVDACVAAISGDNPDLALWALRYMHDPKAADGLMTAYQNTDSEELKAKILTTLARIYHKEAPYDGSWWWSTRPDTHGPYYKTAKWESSDKIATFLRGEWKKANSEQKALFADLNGSLRMKISEFGGEEEVVAQKSTDIDLEDISNKKGQVGEASIEDIMLAIADIKGDPALGEKLFTQQGCVACHSLKKSEPMKGPFMGQIGSIMTRDQIAESILKPNASISQGFASVVITAKGNKSYAGFVSEESADKVVMRNIAGQVFTINTEDIISREELKTSMMPMGLANALSYEEFAALVTFLAGQKR
ncbi:MAG: PQQ-dependent sugar dehydrogenase [Bacteroidia bacterium]